MVSNENKKNKDNRARNFATVFYPDSCPEDLEAKLAELCIPSFLSPLHDKDINPTGEPKKPHYHYMLMFAGKKSPEQVRELLRPLGAVGLEVVSDVRSYARYLCHLDNPEKHQYPIDEVRSFGGADYLSVITVALDKYKAIGEMMDFIESEDILTYVDLLQYAKMHRSDWFRALCDHCSMQMIEYIKSRFWKIYKQEKEILESGKGASRYE